MERKKKPSNIPISPSIPQPTIHISDLSVTATLPNHDTVTVHLLGATVISWTHSLGAEQLFLSTAAKLDGTKAIRGGIPIVFPAFGPPPKDHATGKLPQHGFARSVMWEFLGKNSSESASGKRGDDDEVKLDFGLSSNMLTSELRDKWAYDFGLVYSVTLGPGYLETGLHVQNKGSEAFEFQALFHNYFRIKDISQVSIHGLESKPFFDKVSASQSPTPPPSDPLTVLSATDRVYSSLHPSDPITISESHTTKYSIQREALTECTVWNPWEEGARGMSDFEPKTGYREMVCVEPGVVSGWVRLEGGDAWEGGQTIRTG